jgi:hypothetical protein
MITIVIPSILGLIVFFLISVFVYIVKNPEIVDKWSYLFNKLKIFKNEKTEKNIISKNIDHKITSVSKRINEQAQGIMPFGVRIQWRNSNEVESYLKKDEVIVVLKKEDNCDKNIVDICLAFVPKALLPKSRNCIEPNILKSIDSFMVKTILNEGTYDSAYNYFMQNIFTPFIESDQDLKDKIQVLSHLNEVGFFTRILLEEYRRLGEKLYGTTEEQSFFEESYNFLVFLDQLANRKPGDNSSLFFDGTRIKIAILFLAKYTTYEFIGLDAYISRIDKNIKMGVQRIFILSYAQRYEKSIKNQDGLVISVQQKKDFISLSKLEKECSNRNDIRLLKKQKYKTKDVTGRDRSAKYLLYEVVR